MANLVETSRWEAGIYQFETSDPVMGGPNGIDNRPTRELANRTLWLKNELATALASIGANKTSADQALTLKADKAVRMIAGAGLSGGGDLSADRTIALATPSTLNGSTTNWVGDGATGHTHELAKATPTLAGVAKLVNVLDSSATDAAVSAAMAKKLQDEKLGNSGSQTLSGQLNIFRNGWEKIRFSNADSSFWRFESAPVSSGENGARFNYVFTGADGSEVGRISFPRVSTGETVAYQSWVSTQIGAAVMLTGNQTIEGIKTFSAPPYFSAGIRFSAVNKDGWAELGMGPNDIYMRNPASSKVLQLKDDGTLAYSNDKIMLASDKASTTVAGIVQLSESTNSTAVNLAATPSAVKAAYDLAAAAAPSGTVAFFAGQAAPAGWLKANGAAVSRTVYAALFAAIGTRYGAGDGSTTFNLPDLRGLFPRALDDGRGVDSGRVLGSRQEDAMQRWFAEFTYQRAQVSGVETLNGAIQHLATGYSTAQPASGGWAVARAIIGPDVNNSARVAGETRPTNMALLACIKI